jgi:hypothetical protein
LRSCGCDARSEVPVSVVIGAAWLSVLDERLGF